MAAPFDPSRLELTGRPPVMAGVLQQRWGGHYSISSTGTLAYMSDEGRAPDSLVWVDRSDAPVRSMFRVALMPGSSSRRMARAALDHSSALGKQSIVIWDFNRHALSTVTRDSGVSEAPIWMADGANLLFASRPQLGALGRLFRSAPMARDADPAHDRITCTGLCERRRVSACRPMGPRSSTRSRDDSDGINVLDVAAGRTRMLVPRGRWPRLSPDGRWLAYMTGESGIGEVYVSPYPNVASARWQVSTGGGVSPRWSHDSTELFYRGLGSNRSHMYVLKVGGGATLQGVRPQLLVDVPDSGSNELEEFDVGPDGRFLVLKGLPQNPPIPHVIVNWLDVLKQAVPANGRASK